MNNNELIEEAKKVGFTYHGKTPNGHLLFLNDEGKRVTAAGTASDWRSHLNAIAAMERISGIKRMKPNHGKPRKKGDTSGFLNTIRTESAEHWSEKVGSIVDEYKTLALEFRIISSAEADRTDLNRAMEIIRRMARLEDVLTELRQPIPQTDLPANINHMKKKV
jgi:hypothetical protein